MRFFTPLCFFVGALILAWPLPKSPGQGKPAIKILHTPSGIRFGLLGQKGPAPAPTLFVLASSLEDSLSSDDFNKCGRMLAKKGFLCVSVDMPCHGKDGKPNEPAGLAGWRARLEKGDDLVGSLSKRLSALLDYLIKEGYTDAGKVAVCGTSRGGFMALHFAAVEPRVRWVAAFAPVTDLLILSEFSGMQEHAATKSLALVRHAEKLAGRDIWLCIGNNDQRVGTDQAITFTRKVVAAALSGKKPAPVELHVMPTIGHTIHATAHAEVAAWVLRRLEDKK